MPVLPKVAPEIFARHPDFHLASLTIRGAVVLRPDAGDLAALVAEAEASLHAEDAARDAHLAAWDAAYRGFGAKPNRTLPSASALLKRSRKDGALPRIAPLVDAYNAVSILHGIPVGGEDLAQYRGDPQLIVAKGDEPFDTMLNGQPVVEMPDPGEVIWRDDLGVTCRRWNWRQGRRTMITDASRDIWLVLEALAPMPAARLQAAAERLAGTVLSLCPGAEIDLRRLDMASPDMPAQANAALPRS
jgi:DNA/RNA-binding domain of Phe-tRNA-synthetase-like protein